MGLDVRFLGRKWQNKNNCHGNGNRMSHFWLPSSLRFRGRAFAGFIGTLNASPPRAKAWVERSEGLLRVGFLGILHCVQDDSRNLQRQLQMQMRRQLQLQMQRQLQMQMQMQMQRQLRGFFAALRMTRMRGGDGGRELQRREI